MNDHDLGVFEQLRPRLVGLACRILGSRADAEDAVQECFLKWRDTHRGAIASPAAWLSTVCTRRCLDLLRAVRRARVDYTGLCLPETIQSIAPGADSNVAAPLTTAFLLMLEWLTPKERAAYLLHDVFDQPFRQIAATLEMKEGACQKLVERARAHIDRGRVRHATPVETQARLLRAFQLAITTGSPAELAALLARDVRLTTRGGGKTTTRALPVSLRETALHHLRGHHNDEIAKDSRTNHRRSGQDRRTSQRAA